MKARARVFSSPRAWHMEIYDSHGQLVNTDYTGRGHHGWTVILAEALTMVHAVRRVEHAGQELQPWHQVLARAPEL